MRFNLMFTALITSSLFGCTSGSQNAGGDSASQSKLAQLRLQATAENSVKIEQGKVYLDGKFLIDLPAKDRLKMQECLRKASYYPRLPDGVLAPEVTRLLDGRIFVSGGIGRNNTYSAGTWIYDEKNNQLIVGAKIAHQSIKHATLLLNDGKVLISGGSTARPQEIENIQIWNPSQNSVSQAGILVYPRYEHSMIELAPGKIVITGGATRNGEGDEIELYDLSTAKSRMIGRLKQPRKQHDCIKVGENKIVLLGGQGFEHGAEPLPPEVVVIPENK